MSYSTSPMRRLDILAYKLLPYAHKRKSKKGFTLVELSIVLVIIGLLIGGILVAQSMISTAKIQSFVRQTQQYDVAIANFKNKFDGLPGDDRSYSGGDGDGYVALSNIATGGDCCDYYFRNENRQFWLKLFAAENIINTLSDTVGNVPKVGYQMPYAKIGAKDNAVLAQTNNTVRAVQPLKTVYRITRIPINNTNDAYYGSPNNTPPGTSAAETLAIDKKLDDGIANNGIMQAAGAGPGSGADNTAGSGCVVNGNAALYNVASTSQYPCAFQILILPNQ